MKNFFIKLRNSKHSTPLFVLMFLGLIVIIIGSFIGAVYLIGNVAGIASIAFLLIGVIIFGVFSKYPQRNSSIVLAFLIVLFTVTGAAVDQAGNYIYNLPVEYLMCPEGTELNRNVLVRYPLPERTEFVQEFSCVDKELNVVENLSLAGILGIRFVEYIILAILLLLARSLLYKLNLFGRNRGE